MIDELTKNLFIHMRTTRQSAIGHVNRAGRSMMDHLAIIEALERRESEEAERLVRQHTLDLAAHVERCCTYLACAGALRASSQPRAGRTSAVRSRG